MLDEWEATGEEAWQLHGGGKRSRWTCTPPTVAVLRDDPEPLLDGWEGCRTDQWVATAINVTSLQRHIPDVFELGSDLLFLSETRVPAEGVIDMQSAAQKVGYALQFGNPVARTADRGRPQWGGVALACQGHMKLELIHPSAYGAMQEFFESSQFVAGWVTPPDDSYCLLACSYYGRCGHTDHSEQLVTKMAEWIGQMEVDYWIAGGDLNLTIEECTALQQWIGLGRCHHAVRAANGESQHTCLHGHGREIDHLLISPRMYAMLTTCPGGYCFGGADTSASPLCIQHGRRTGALLHPSSLPVA